MASTRVVLPWSTWAMIATLRMSSLVWIVGIRVINATLTDASSRQPKGAVGSGARGSCLKELIVRSFEVVTHPVRHEPDNFPKRQESIDHDLCTARAGARTRRRPRCPGHHRTVRH